jgi:Bacterial archaeo-eukaryotic release factor family 3
MTATNPNVTQLLRRSVLREILRSPGPCVTILLPAYRPGEPASSPAALLKSTVREAAQRLDPFLPAKSVSLLLGPLERAANDPELASGSRWGRAIFRSPGVFEQLQLTRPVKPCLTLAGSFSIRSLMDDLVRPETFYILKLSKTKVAVLRCHGLDAEYLALPGGIPETLKEALQLEPPDHDLENRTFIGSRTGMGSSTGAMRGVRFGTGSGRETKHAHLGDFYKLVDRGVAELAREAPLILAGVEEDVSIFRAVSNHRRLVRESIPGSADFEGSPDRHMDDLLQKAYAILRTDTADRQVAALLSAKERVAAGRFSTDTDLIVRAAFEGRVEELYTQQGAEQPAVFERGAYQSWGPEDLLNLAAVQTILHDGHAYEVSAGRMPEGAAVAAILRY